MTPEKNYRSGAHRKLRIMGGNSIQTLKIRLSIYVPCNNPSHSRLKEFQKENKL